VFKYVVPSAAIGYVSRLHRSVAELVISIEGSVNLIVLRTPPGSAPMVASAVDEAAWPEILGTIGGDDTILVIVRSAEDTPHVKQRFLDLRGASAA
jgi:transcriptional regulator of arginine metabolism